MKTIFNNTRSIARAMSTTVLALSLSSCLGISGLQEEETFSSLDAYVAEGAQGLHVEYYKNTDGNPNNAFQKTSALLGTRVEPLDLAITNADPEPFPGVGRGGSFSARYTGYFVAPQTGKYQLCTCSDDGVRMWVNGSMVIDRFQNQGARFWGTGSYDLNVGDKLPIRIDYLQSGGNGVMQLFYVFNPTGNWEASCNSVGSIDANTGNPVGRDLCHPLANGFVGPVNAAAKRATSALLIPSTSYSEATASCNQPVRRLAEAELPNAADANVQKALKLFDRLAGVKTNVYDARVKQVASLLSQGKDKEAARIVSEDNSFLDVTVRKFAAKMSTREQRPDVALNDFIATVVGVTRDRIDARQLLTGNFLYRANERIFFTDNNLYSAERMLTSNGHYDAIEATKVPLKCSLDKITDMYMLPKGFEQTLAGPTNVASVNPDPAGLLTSRAFGEAHIIAGTNRRPVEKTFEYFHCAPVDNIRTAEGSDEYVGRDVERLPNGSGSNNDFQTNCKTCHQALDSLRPAFAKYHYENGKLKYAPLYANARATNSDANETAANLKVTHTNNELTTPTRNNQQGNMDIVWKMNHNSIYPDGYFVKNDSFVNTFANTTLGSSFGWVDKSGSGVREYGRMFARAQAFPRCMAKKVYNEVCRVNPLAKAETEQQRADLATLNAYLDGVGDQFAQAGYDLRDLFETLATTCLQ